ncbi:alpha/beta fold hydrolase [Limosilactobacillus gastricus]|uniref:Hydrolase n=1 Tax=Limosilactobacillus gastricus DSM 16045 TaxID=1423749 RepID=A0A0R1VBL8_9LACO|nr:alpha/beta hydrolase [Limosilactobacillus gastricus]KRM01483.1 Hydrolase [Limosilactobacillus gastricus DSM 16045]QGF41025.1 alpha/beta fold hydrolase [Limosilactobacillus gastricus]
MKYQTIDVDGIKIFYREAGDPAKPTLLLLHGFPSASHMFRDLMPALADHFHLIAPDYPGFGQSQSPDRDHFAYTFDHLAQVMDHFLDQLKIDQFLMYVFDYGAPIGFRLASWHPEKIVGIISQNGNVYEEGLGPKWAQRAEYWQHPTPELRRQYQSAFARETVIGQYTYGTPAGSVSPDGYSLDLYYAATIDDYAEKQSDLIFDYQSNVRLYPQFQAYLRQYQPKLLAIWGKEDPSFIWAGAEAFKKDLPDARIIPVASGHFALENCCPQIATEIINFFG